MKITGNTVLITGGTSGIGLSIAKVFLENMNTVIVCGRNIVKLDQVKKQYLGIHTFQCDVSSPVELNQMFEYVTSSFPSLNILVNNAGIQYRYDFLKDESALQKIDAEIDINFRAATCLTKIILPNLVRAREEIGLNLCSLNQARQPTGCASP